MRRRAAQAAAAVVLIPTLVACTQHTSSSGPPESPPPTTSVPRPASTFGGVMRWTDGQDTFLHPASWHEWSHPGGSTSTMVYPDVALTDTAVGDPCSGIATGESCDFVPEPLRADAVWVDWFKWQGPADSVGPGNARWHATRIAGFPAKIAEGSDLGLRCLPAPGITVRQMLATISAYGPSGQTVVMQACYSPPDLDVKRTQLLTMLRSYGRVG